MNTNELTRTPQCAAIEPLLPLLDTGGLTTHEEDTARLHLTGCAHCRARVAADDIVAHALRRHAGLDAAPAPNPLVTFDDVRNIVTQEDAPVPVPPTRQQDSRGSRRALSGVAALAAVLLIAVLAQALFSSRPRPGSGGHPTTPFNGAALAHALVYVGTSDGIYAVHAATGTLAWRYPAVASPGASSPATIGCLVLSSGVLYACSAGTIIAVRASDGKLLWRRLIQVIGSAPAGLSIVAADSTVYVATTVSVPTYEVDPSANYVLALNAATGAVVWSHPSDEAITSAPAAVNGAVYIATSAHLDAFRARDGTLLWRSPLGGGAAPQGVTPTGPVASVITATTGAIYVSALENVTTRPASSQGSASIIATPSIYQIAPRDGSHLWKSSYPSCACVSPYAVSISTGSAYFTEDSSLWQFMTAPIGMGWRFTGFGELRGPVLANGILYLTDTGQDPNTHDTDTLAIDPTTGNTLWRTGTEGGTLSQPPAVGGGAVFSGGGGILYALRGDTGGVLWRYQTDGNIQTTPPVVGGAG